VASPKITVRYFAGARAAAGVAEETLEAATLGEVVTELAGRGEPLTRVLTACSYLVNGLAARDHDIPLVDGATVDVLPPFAGG
jgi:molybdopterin converting factor small subunit